jgi:hypothetical protein
MPQSPKLFMVLLGCRPKGRYTEQHDVFFAIGQTVKDLVPEIIASWPEAKGVIHIDAWREVTSIGEYKIEVQPYNLQQAVSNEMKPKIFFINLGGYRRNEFDEFHYKMLVVGLNKNSAIQQAKETAFYKHTGFKGAPGHIDDKYGIDVDDLYEIKDILPLAATKKYSITISPSTEVKEDEIHLGYFKLDKL